MVYTSDRSVKKNIVEYYHSLEELMPVNPVYYEYNGGPIAPDTGKVHVGLIADELEQTAFAGTVSEETFTDPNDPDGPGVTLKTVNKTEIIHAMFNALKAINNRLMLLEQDWDAPVSATSRMAAPASSRGVGAPSMQISAVTRIIDQPLIEQVFMNRGQGDIVILSSDETTNTLLCTQEQVNMIRGAGIRVISTKPYP